MAFEGIYCYDRATVTIAVHPKGPISPRVLVEISESVVRGWFGASGGPSDLLAACEMNFAVIQTKALERYALTPRSPVALDMSDFREVACQR